MVEMIFVFQFQWFLFDIFGKMPDDHRMTVKDKKKKTNRIRKVVRVSDFRIEARVSEDEKITLQRAADMLHLSLSDFIRTKVIPSAEAVIEEREILKLNREDSIKFVKALINPPKKSTEKFRRGAAKYKEAVAKGIFKSDLE